MEITGSSLQTGRTIRNGEPEPMGNETEKVLGDLDGAKSMTAFFEKNREAFIDKPIRYYIDSEIQKRGFTKKKIIKESGINRRYFFDILSGKKTPDRRYIIRILLALRMELGDAQWYP